MSNAAKRELVTNIIDNELYIYLLKTERKVKVLFSLLIENKMDRYFGKQCLFFHKKNILLKVNTNYSEK